MRSADQAPLGLDLGQSPEKELAEPHGLFDLSEYRLHNLFAKPVASLLVIGVEDRGEV